MLAVHPGVMHNGVGHPDPARSHENFHRPQSYSSPHPSTQGHSHRPLIELPRLPETRGYAQGSLSVPPGEQRGQDRTPVPAASRPESRRSGPSLPAFKDMFSTPSTYAGQWDGRTGPPVSHHTRDSRIGPPEWFPSLALNAASSSLPASAGSERRLDVRMADSSPISRPLARPISTSPYAYPEAGDRSEAPCDRLRRDSTLTYRTGPSSYAPASHEDHAYMSPGAGYDRSSVATPNSSSAPDNQRMYLGVREIPGEGNFHLYDGGYRIPTQIDGEQVNPAWGLTKANKPRKRLALACLDCREKKIKCEPGAISCVQCEKAKRPCRRAPLQPSTGDTPPAATWSSSAGSPPHTGVSNVNGTGDSNFDAMSKRRAGEELCSPAALSKKHRSASLSYNTRDPSHHVPIGAAYGKSPPTEHGRPLYAWEEDPFTTEPETTLHLLDLYLMHVNNATVCMFPRHTFWHWVKTCRHKSDRETMVLYAVLAVGSIFADEQYTVVGERFARIATEAIMGTAGLFDLFGVQTRLLLAVFYAAEGQETSAWDLTGAALRAATSNDLRINVETEDMEEARCQQDLREHDRAVAHAKKHFSFTRQQYHECKRRTFWACFLRDRFSASTLCAINLQDIHLRLPNTDDMYEHSLRSEAPYYNNGIVEPLEARIAPTSPVCPTGWLVQVAAIWGDVLNFTNRSVHRGASTYRESYDTFYSETNNRMQDWTSRLPEYLQYNPSNIERSIRGDYADAFITMHAVYHFTFMRLNRYVRHAVVRDLVARNIRAALYHAQQVLSMMTALRAADCESISPLTRQRCDFFASTPFVGNIIMSAIDIAGAGGLDTNLGSTLDAISGGLGCLIVFSRYWTSAKDQHRESQKRYYQIQNMVHQPFKARSGCWLGREWGMEIPLEKDFESKDDCIYGATEDSGKPNELYFNALKGDIQEDTAHPGGPPRH